MVLASDIALLPVTYEDSPRGRKESAAAAARWIRH
jgi:hypothetical protein